MIASNAQYRVKIMSANLFVKQATVAPAVKLAHSRALQHTSAKYVIDRLSLKTFSIPVGTRVYNQENLYLGQISKFNIVGVVNNEGHTGSYTINRISTQS